MTPNEFLTRHEVAERWRTSVQTVDRLRAAGKLPWIDVSGQKGGRAIVRFKASDVQLFEEQMRRSGQTVSQRAADEE